MPDGVINILTVIGARPQFIKAAVISKKLPDYIHERIIHTGQHYDVNMSDVFFEELSIPKPAFSLNIGSSTHGVQTGRMLESLESIYLSEKPDAILVYGDTNSTLAGALAASKLNIPVFHVEAGLRSFNKNMPEEQNRIIVDHLSSLLFCPTHTAVANLRNENIIQGVHKVGDIMYDSILCYHDQAKAKYETDWYSCLSVFYGKISDDNFILCTIHRAENTANYDNLFQIFSALNEFGESVIMPVHPRIRKTAIDLVTTNEFNNIILVEPVNYLLMIYLTGRSSQVVTDSGGLQKEAYFLGVPCTTPRNDTEWIETLIDNKNILTGCNKSQILNALASGRKKWIPDITPFGDGRSADKIVEVISKWTQKN